VLYFLWKNHAISHTIADYPQVLERGLCAIAADARRQAAKISDAAAAADADAAGRRDFYQGVVLCLEAVIDYAGRLADEAEAVARRCGSSAHAEELRALAGICRRVPASPAQTLQEALNSVWICFLAQHQENTNAGLPIGRLDTWLQPYLERDLRGALEQPDPERLDAAIRRAVELTGAFMLKGTDHLPLVADIGNRLFGGSSSDQVITLGGQRPDGSSAVGDMTYIFLKATEMLALRDPNMNARFAPGVDPDYYLRRLCEVNLITGATPSMHGDGAMVAALQRQGIPTEAARDWGATGCVEPTICGQHMGHTNCMMFNLVAPLEMALHDGVHPLLEEQVGPRTGDPRALDDYAAVLAAFETQLLYLIDSAVEANNLLGQAHQQLHPTPFLSSLIQGTLAAGRDVVDGGARYNSSGVAVIGLADVVDSLAAIKSLVFDSRRWTLATLLEALEQDFEGHEALRAEILHRVPRFGGGHPLPTGIATHLLDLIFERFQGHQNYRGGRYLPGYWSMSNHVAFGLLSGALPSGRRRGKPFTPGLTPSSLSTDALTEQIRQVAALDPNKLPNNIAFNIKIAPGGTDRHSQVVERMVAYARTYFDLGGMQLQFNAISSETMRDAMEHPERHRDLLVRISGYNAYFVQCNRDMQLELIDRTEHG
jgi:pyruvate-formate lyase